MKEIIVVNGYPLSGKDTFMDYCIATLTLRDRKAVKFSSIDTVKQAASLLGWPGTKEDKDRDFLSTLKNLSTQYYDNPFSELVSFCENSPAEVIFLAVREPEEILKLENYFKSKNDIKSINPP